MSETIPPPTSTFEPPRRGFTLIEILVVIGIIVILIGILIPVVSKARKSAQAAAVQAQINDLSGIIEQYQRDHGAYPGPLTRDQIRVASFNLQPNTASTEHVTTLDSGKITMAENLVLGLAGGLKVVTTSTPPVVYDPSLVGGGPMNLNPAAPKKGRAYIDQKNLSWRIDEATGRKTGKYQDGAGVADDTEIPEILDTFPNPMPILYLRATKGANPTEPPVFSATHNRVITDVPTPGASGAAPQRDGQYDLSQIFGYTSTTIGEGKDIDVNEYTGTKPPAGQLRHGLATVNKDAALNKDAQAPLVYAYPYDAFAYFKDPASSSTTPEARKKDGFILISAGLDRVYGTADDIANFGAVVP